MHQPRETDSPERLMTFAVAGEWLAVRLSQMDRVALVEKLWPIPLTWPNYVGMFDDAGELTPVLTFAKPQAATDAQALIAILRVRGQSLGFVIDKAGRLYNAYDMLDNPSSAPPALSGLPIRAGRNADTSFWLLDTDLLWEDGPAPLAA